MNTQRWLTNLYLIKEFLRRDFYITAAKLSDYTVNYVLISPLIFNIGVGFLQAPIYFSHDPVAFCNRMLPGNLLMLMMALSFRNAFDLLFDLENNKFVNYQLMLLNPRLILVERILFGTLYTFFSVAPFFFVAKMILGNLLSSSDVSWIGVYGVIFAGAFCCSAYHMFTVCVISLRQVSMLWIRVNFFLTTLARLPIPIRQAYLYSDFLSYAMYACPMVYFVEGVNRAFTQSTVFFALPISMGVLLVSGIIFTVLSWIMFKKRVDHI